MKTEPRLPQITVAQSPVPAPKGRLDGVLDRLALTGYRVDREKWKRFHIAHLVDAPLPTEGGEREAIRRLRRILDVERRLAPSGDVNALCFHLTAAGIDGVPAAPVARHIIEAVEGLFALGDRLQAESTGRALTVGPDGEFRIGRDMAKAVLLDYLTRDRVERKSFESLLAAAFVAYVRSTYSNPRPAQMLHASSRLVTLDVDDESPKPKRTARVLPPLADRAGIVQWLNVVSSENESAVMRAVQSVASFIRLHVHRYPELQAPWRDLAGEGGPHAGSALQALALVPPVLAAAYLQAGSAPAAPSLERTLEQLMHFWGTVSIEAVRFDLSNGAFPWVPRSES